MSAKPKTTKQVARKGFAATKTVKIVEIDADTWAESGGTAGIFGKAWREGRLKIVPSEFE